MAIDHEDRVYIALKDGSIWRLGSFNSSPEHITNAQFQLNGMALVRENIVVTTAENSIRTYDLDGVLLDQMDTLYATQILGTNAELGQILLNTMRVAVDAGGSISTSAISGFPEGVVDPTLQYTLNRQGSALSLRRIDDDSLVATKVFSVSIYHDVLAWTDEAIYVAVQNYSGPANWKDLLVLDPLTLATLEEHHLVAPYIQPFPWESSGWNHDFTLFGETPVPWVTQPGPGGQFRLVPCSLEVLAGGGNAYEDRFGGWIRTMQATWSAELGYVLRGPGQWVESSRLGWMWVEAVDEANAWVYRYDTGNWNYSSQEFFPYAYYPEDHSWHRLYFHEGGGHWYYNVTMDYWGSVLSGWAPFLMDGRWVVVDPEETYGPSQLTLFESMYFLFDTNIPELLDFLPVAFPYTYTRIDNTSGYVDFTEGVDILEAHISGYFTMHFTSPHAGTLDSVLTVTGKLPGSPTLVTEDEGLPFVIVPKDGWSR